MSSREGIFGFANSHRRLINPFAAGFLALFLAATLGGCAWVGKGHEVAKALEKTGTLRTDTFAGFVRMEPWGNGSGEIVEISFVGEDDASDRTNPKSWVDITAKNQRFRVVVPGDGNTYIETRNGTFGAPKSVSDAANETELRNVFAALESAITNFREGEPEMTKDGTRLQSIVADGKINEICDNVVPAFLEFVNTARANSGALELPSGDAPKNCRRLLFERPAIRFGIDAEGYMRMIAVRTSLSLFGRGIASMDMRFDITSMNLPAQIEKPERARMLASESELVSRIAEKSADAAR